MGDMLDAMSESAQGPSHDPADAEVVDLCRDLIRIDTTNYGDDSGPGERKAAEYVAALLDEVGIESRLYESEPGPDVALGALGRARPAATRCCCTATSTSYRPRPRTGRSTRSRARSRTATSGAAARST